MPKNVVKAIPMTVVDATTVSLLTPLNSEGLPEACFRVRIHNVASQPLFLSYDGINPNEYLAEAGEPGDHIDLDARAQPNTDQSQLLWKKGQVFYGTYITPPAGGSNITISGYYFEQ